MPILKLLKCVYVLCCVTLQGPFDVCRKVLAGGEEAAKMTLNDKSDLFFQDYSFGPLFVQENYITCTPYAARLGSMRTPTLLNTVQLAWKCAPHLGEIKTL